MKSVKEKIFKRIRDDATIRSLLGLPAIVSPDTTGPANGQIVWNYLPQNPIYPCIVYKRVTTKNELRFKYMQTAIAEMYFEIYILSDNPDPSLVDDLKDRITVLFQDTQEQLSDSYMNYYLSEVIDDAGDIFQTDDKKYYTTMRLRFKLQKVCDIVNNM